LTLVGNSLTITADGKTITGGTTPITIANAGQKLTIKGGDTGVATVAGFTNAIDNTNGGRNGVGIQAGLRWSIGKDPSSHKTSGQLEKHVIK